MDGIEDEEANIAFTRGRIYANIGSKPGPKNYENVIPWNVQGLIAGTNGTHYLNRIGKLKEYPVYEMPVDKVKGEHLMLDIGCGWGRWLTSGANKGYIPIGVDIKLNLCHASLLVMKTQNVSGYAVSADLTNMPFKDNIFDLVWSFSVIQHTHYERMVNCLQRINSILTNEGFTLLEFPNKNGLRNRKIVSNQSIDDINNYNSWCVRYYTPAEYETIVSKFLSHYSFYNHSFLGIGVLKEDLKYVSFSNKIKCAISLLFSAATNVIPNMKNYSDSIYIRASKKETSTKNTDISRFLKLHHSNPGDNLNIVSLLKCPKYGGDLVVSEDRKKLISLEAGIYYPVEKDVPVLVKSEAVSIS